MAGFFATVALSASAQLFSISVDENGNLKINGNPGPPGVIGIEPISGQQALCYQLPGFAGNPGDILMAAMNEPPTAGQISDLIRFPGNGNMYFFSLRDDNEPPDLADVPALPPPINPNIVTPEVGPEGNNSSNYFPGPGGIGGDPNNPNLQYVFISDVPEPSVGLLGIVGGGFALVANRFRRSRRN